MAAIMLNLVLTMGVGFYFVTVYCNNKKNVVFWFCTCLLLLTRIFFVQLVCTVHLYFCVWAYLNCTMRLIRYLNNMYTQNVRTSSTCRIIELIFIYQLIGYLYEGNFTIYLKLCINHNRFPKKRPYRKKAL